MNAMARTIFSGLPICFVLGGCSLGFVPTGLTPAKAYGQYWVKPGMSLEGWRQDWVRCGGRENGQYSSDARNGAPSTVIQTAEKRKRDELAVCMKSKGYSETINPFTGNP